MPRRRGGHTLPGGRVLHSVWHRQYPPAPPPPAHLRTRAPAQPARRLGARAPARNARSRPRGTRGTRARRVRRVAHARASARATARFGARGEVKTHARRRGGARYSARGQAARASRGARNRSSRGRCSSWPFVPRPMSRIAACSSRARRPRDGVILHPEGRGGATLSAGRSARSRARAARRARDRCHDGTVRPAVAVPTDDRRGRPTGRCRAAPRFRRATPPGRPHQRTTAAARQSKAFGRLLRAFARGAQPRRARARATAPTPTTRGLRALAGWRLVGSKLWWVVWCDLNEWWREQRRWRLLLELRGREPHFVLLGALWQNAFVFMWAGGRGATPICT